MSRPLYAPKESYVGTGSLDTYTFNFKIEAKSQLLVIEVDDSGVETQRVRGTDVTYLTSVVFDAVDGGGTVVLAANLPTDYDLIFLLANDAPTQDYEFRNKTTFTLKRFESALDFIAGAVQRLAYRGKQAFRIHDLDDEDTFNGQFPSGVSAAGDKVLKINSAGTGVEYGPTAGDISNAEAYANAAALSASAAATAETNAETAETNAETAETNAETAETNAAASAAAAALSEKKFATFASTAAFVTDKGSAAAEGDVFGNTTSREIYYFTNSAWHPIADLDTAQTFTNKTHTSPVLNTGVSGTAVLDEDDMISDSNTKLATQQSIKKYVDDSAGVTSILLASDHELIAGDFPDTTNLYGWHSNASGAYADEDWVGGEALTEVGAITAETDFLGNASRFVDLDGTNDALYSSGTAFDTASESFTMGGWFLMDRISTDEILMSKLEVDDADRSFGLFHDVSEDNLNFIINYNSSAGTVQMSAPRSELTNGLFHFVVIVYDQANTSMMIMVDGRVVAYKIDANLTTRNNGTTSELCFGGQYDDVAGLSQPFDGRICETFYKKTALTVNEIKKVYVAGFQGLAVQETKNNNVSILDGRNNDGIHFVRPTSSYVLTSSFVNAPGHVIYIPANKRCRIFAGGMLNLTDSDGNDAEATLRFSDGSIVLPNSTFRYRIAGNSTSEGMLTQYFLETEVYRDKDTVITLQGKMAAGDNCDIFYSAGSSEPFIAWELLN